jgi:hypothetical protein
MPPAGTIGRRLEDTIALYAIGTFDAGRQIARLLNRSGKSTGYGNGWTEQRAASATTTTSRYTATANGQTVEITPMRLYRSLCRQDDGTSHDRRGDPAKAACKGAPWSSGAGWPHLAPQPINGSGNTNPAQQISSFSR